MADPDRPDYVPVSQRTAPSQWWRRPAEWLGVDDEIDAARRVAGQVGTTVDAGRQWLRTQAGLNTPEALAQRAALERQEQAWTQAAQAQQRQAQQRFFGAVQAFLTFPPVQQKLAELQAWATDVPPAARTGAYAMRDRAAVESQRTGVPQLLHQLPAAFTRDKFGQRTGVDPYGLALAPLAGLGRLREWLPTAPVDYIESAATPVGAALAATDVVDPIGPALHGAGSLLAKAGLHGGDNVLGAGLRAYHGSPHDFPKFDYSKIGTGEGAQTYGHGLYFAGNEDVALDYRNRLGGRADRMVEGGGRLPNWVATDVERSLNSGNAGYPQGIDDLLTDFKARLGEAEERVASKAPQWWNDETRAASLREVVQGLENVKSGAKIAPAGRMYEVDLDVDPAHLLSLDHPLHAQTPHVQEALGRAGYAPRPPATWQAHQITPEDIAAGSFGPNMQPGDWTSAKIQADGTIQWHSGARYASEADAAHNAAVRTRGDVKAPDTGHAVYNDLASQAGSAAQASAQLREAGVPGIRYLDQGSRGRAPDLPYIESSLRQAEDVLARQQEQLLGAGVPEDQLDTYTAHQLAQTDVAYWQQELDRAKAFDENLTHNYVMFSDEPIDILRKYALPLAGGAAGAAAASQAGEDGETGLGPAALMGAVAPFALPGPAGSLANALKRTGTVGEYALRAPTLERLRRLYEHGISLPYASNWSSANAEKLLRAFDHDPEAALQWGRMWAATSPQTNVPENTRESVSALAHAIRNPGQALTIEDAHQLPGAKITLAPSKVPNINRALAGEPLGGDKVEAMGGYMSGQQRLPLDVHALFGLGADTDKLATELPGLRALMTGAEGLPRSGGLTNTDLYTRTEDALGRALRGIDPKRTKRGLITPAFGDLWEGIRAYKGLKPQGAPIDILGARGLLERGAMLDPERMQQALEQTRQWAVTPSPRPTSSKSFLDLGGR